MIDYDYRKAQWLPTVCNMTVMTVCNKEFGVVEGKKRPDVVRYQEMPATSEIYLTVPYRTA